MDGLGGGEIGAPDGEEIGAEGSYVIVLSWVRLSLWSRQRVSSGRTNNLIGFPEESIVDAGAFSGRGMKASVLLSEKFIKCSCDVRHDRIIPQCGPDAPLHFGNNRNHRLLICIDRLSIVNCQFISWT